MDEGPTNRGFLDIEPRTRADREFRLAYRSNLGRKVEDNLLQQASESYLRELLLAADDKMASRIEKVLDARHGNGTASLMRRFTKLFER